MITPEIAQLLLAINTKNRVLNRGKVEGHKELMARGRWKINGDTIRVSKTGRLIDSQHKLTAIAEGGFSYLYTIIWGLEDEVQETIDVGSKRSLGQALDMRGEKRAVLLGATARMTWQIENGGTPLKYLREPSYTEYAEYVDAHPALRSSVDLATQVVRHLNAPASPVAAAHYMCAQVDATLADDFFSDVGDVNSALPNNSVALALRKSMIKWSSRGSMSRMEQACLYDLMVRSFNMEHAKATPPAKLNVPRSVSVWRLPV